MTRPRPVPERRPPGVRSVVLYEADLTGVDRVILATSEPAVVRAVEKALAERLRPISQIESPGLGAGSDSK